MAYYDISRDCPTCYGQGSVREADPESRQIVNNECSTCQGSKRTPKDYVSVRISERGYVSSVKIVDGERVYGITTESGRVINDLTDSDLRASS